MRSLMCSCTHDTYIRDLSTQISKRGKDIQREKRCETPGCTVSLSFCFANVSTLSPASSPGLVGNGRSLAPQTLFHNASYDGIGVQESTMQQSTSRDGFHYEIITSSATKHGFGEAQLWQGNKAELQIFSIAPLSHRALAWRVRFRGVEVVCGVAHIPDASSVEDATSVWRIIFDEFVGFTSGFPKTETALFVDANGRIGDFPCLFIVSHKADEEDLRGEMLRDNLTILELFAENTFESAGPIWHGARHPAHRIDHVCLCSKIHEDCATRYVDKSVSLSNGGCPLSSSCPSTLPRTPPLASPQGQQGKLPSRPDRHLLQSLLHMQAVETHLANFDLASAANSCDTRLARITEHLKSGLRIFDNRSKTPRKS